MARPRGATVRSSAVRARLGAAALTGGGGRATIGRVTAFLRGGGGPKANFVNRAGRTQLGRGAARRGKAGGGGSSG